MTLYPSTSEADTWDRLLAACLFSTSGLAIWLAFAFPTGITDLKDPFEWQVGGAAFAAAGAVGLLGAPGLVRRARGGASLWLIARRGAWLMLLSYALGAVLFGVVIAIEESSLEMYPMIVLFAFLGATVLLSPGLLVGMATAALYGAIVRGESWTGPRMVSVRPGHRTLKDDAFDFQRATTYRAR